MGDIKKEILHALKSQVFQRMWFKVFVVVVVLVLLFAIYRVVINPPIPKGEIGNEQVWENYEDVADIFNSLEFEGVEADKESVNELTFINSEDMATTINLFFVTANKGEQNLFTSTVSAEILEQDFFKYDLGERFTKIDEAMQRISRNGTLTNIEVVRSLPYLKKDVSRIVIDLNYQDLTEPIRVSILVKMIDVNKINSSEGETFEIPYIDSSIWELIEDIERQVD